ncbi:uncharacterized protein B0H64DRAFT_180484 [Chaetomium fimeti]|jgi:hypothetical protein|uniref:BHLH domain-containing protein n=1 Tax=Chaetomium fimeti TaxID=1854472 RepID=A0AAE0HCY8_9PEZI|nr:hypothetical protein B0H64DRAFT_180484 [Chaetomium fimeti]
MSARPWSQSGPPSRKERLRASLQALLVNDDIPLDMFEPGGSWPPARDTVSDPPQSRAALGLPSPEEGPNHEFPSHIFAPLFSLPPQSPASNNVPATANDNILRISRADPSGIRTHHKLPQNLDRPARRTSSYDHSSRVDPVLAASSANVEAGCLVFASYPPLVAEDHAANHGCRLSPQEADPENMTAVSDESLSLRSPFAQSPSDNLSLWSGLSKRKSALADTAADIHSTAPPPWTTDFTYSSGWAQSLTSSPDPPQPPSLSPYGGGGKGEVDSFPEKRQRPHYAIEKRYRAGLNERFEALRECIESRKMQSRQDQQDQYSRLPSLAMVLDAGSKSNSGSAKPWPPTRMNKADVLDKAVVYIRDLEEENVVLLEHLRITIRRLRDARAALGGAEPNGVMHSGKDQQGS